MAKKTYSTNLAESQVMIDGLKGRNDKLPLGVKTEDITKLEELRKKMETLNSKKNSKPTSKLRPKNLVKLFPKWKVKYLSLKNS